MDMFHYGLGHKPIPFLEAVKLPEAKAAVNKEWEKLKTPTCLGRKERKPTPRAKKEGKTIHFANLMDLCHLKNEALAKTRPKVCRA